VEGKDIGCEMQHAQKIYIQNPVRKRERDKTSSEILAYIGENDGNDFKETRV
jgi:hypothetical protein